MYGKILVPLDGSKLAEVVLPYVQELARRFDWEVTLIEVIAPLSKLVAETMPAGMEPAGAGTAVGVEAASEALKAEREDARIYLEGVVGRLKTQEIKLRTEILEGMAGDAIVDYAHDQGMELIAMSTHGRSGLRRLVFGSVADQVFRRAGTPVSLSAARRRRGSSQWADPQGHEGGAGQEYSISSGPSARSSSCQGRSCNIQRTADRSRCVRGIVIRRRRARRKPPTPGPRRLPAATKHPSLQPGDGVPHHLPASR